MKTREQLLRLMDNKKVSDRRLSMLATGSTDTVRNIRRGANPRVSTLEAICSVLGAEIHLSLPQDAAAPEKAPLEILDALGLAEETSLQDAVEAIEQRLPKPGDLRGEELRDQIVRAVKAETRVLRNEIRARLGKTRVAHDLTDDQALAAPGALSGIRQFPGARPIAVHRLQAAAGGGALDLDETVKSYAYFRHEWLSRQGLVADQCSLIGVMGESMEPTLPEGCLILLDRNRRQRREGRIFVVRTDDGLVVKRAGKGADGAWQLVSDHPRWPEVPWPHDAVILGEVRWMASEL